MNNRRSQVSSSDMAMIMIVGLHKLWLEKNARVFDRIFDGP